MCRCPMSDIIVGLTLVFKSDNTHKKSKPNRDRIVDQKIEKLIGKPEIRFTGFKPVTGLQNVQPVVEFL